MADKTYTEAELKEIACKFATWYRDSCIEGDGWGLINDLTGFSIEMNFDKFKAIEL